MMSASNGYWTRDTSATGVESYTGEGVCPSNVAGRTLFDFALGQKTPRVELFWWGGQAQKLCNIAGAVNAGRSAGVAAVVRIRVSGERTRVP